MNFFKKYQSSLMINLSGYGSLADHDVTWEVWPQIERPIILSVDQWF